MVDSAASQLTPVDNAIDIIRHFNRVDTVTQYNRSEYFMDVECQWRVNLPNQFRASGVTDKGVRAIETVLWRIPTNYPISAPEPQLRNDFPTSLPHINPHIAGNRTRPCIAEIPLIDLLHSQGLEAILNTLEIWLDLAAANELHDPSQGWEPMRRDINCGFGFILIDSLHIKAELEKIHTTFQYFDYRYKYYDGSETQLMGILKIPSLGSSNDAYDKTLIHNDLKNSTRRSPGIVLQTPKGIIYVQYQADTVTNLGELKTLAKSFDLYDALIARIRHVKDLFGKAARRNPILPEEFIVTFAVLRPYQLVGSNSCYELIPYRILPSFEEDDALSDASKVMPAHFMEKCSPPLLKKVSGISNNPIHHLSLIGCGSLGSKLALHMAKTGTYKFDLYDNDYFSSHNNARHGLIVEDISSFFSKKSALLAQEIELLNVSVKAQPIDICDIYSNPTHAFNRNTDYIVNTTASLSVNYFFSHLQNNLPGKLVDTLMYGAASLGVVACEGYNRSPRTDDLSAYLQTLCIDSPVIREAMIGTSGPNGHQFGEGCGSFTTIMSDIELSLMACAITSKVDQYIRNNSGNEHGSLLIGAVDKETSNLTWQHHYLLRTTVIKRSDSDSWEIRLVGDTADQITSQRNRYPGQENGGVLAGCICHLSKTIYVTRLLDAPEGSKRAPDKFELSIKGLDEQFDRIHNDTDMQITFLGTWHSHINQSPPSELDKDTLRTLRANSDNPITMLVCCGDDITSVTI